jgi:hypothetical protein
MTTDLANVRAAAAAHYRKALAAGTPPSGAELGRRFHRSDRWGRDRVTEARTASTAALPASPAPATVVPPFAGNPTGMPTGSHRVRTAIRWITTLAVIVVAACAARASYDHQRAVVAMAGESDAAWYLPLSVDGMMLVASLNMLVHRWDNKPAGRLTWCALLLDGAASLAANVAAADPTWIGRLVAAWPPIYLIVSYELLLEQLPTRTSFH